MTEEKLGELQEEIKELRNELREVKEVLSDIAYLLSLQATEVIQITENTSSMLRGEVPSSCKSAHFNLREHAAQIAVKWNSERAGDLKKHLFGHD